MPLGAAPAWLRLEATGFELYTDAGETTGRNVLRHLQTARRLLSDLAPHPPVNEPMRVLLFRDASEFASEQTHADASAFHVRHSGLDHIVLRGAAAATLATAVHEYGHVVLRQTGWVLPLWYEEGWAEYHATITTNGVRIIVGRASSPRLEQARAVPVNLPALVNVTRRSPEYLDPGRARVFYAQAWALVHLIRQAEDYRPQADKFVAALTSHGSAEKALRDVYRRDLATVSRDLTAHLRTHHFRGVARPWTGGDRPDLAVVITVSADEAAVVRAELLTALGQREEARRLVSQVRTDEGSWRFWRGMASLATDAGQRERARGCLRRAAASGATDAAVYFRAAQLESEAGTASETLATLLQKAVDLQPDHAAARRFLAFVLLDLGQYERVRQTLAGHPPRDPEHRADHHRTLSRAAHHLHDQATAMAEAQRALAAARTDAERVELQRWLNVVSGTTAPSPAASAMTGQPSLAKSKGTLRHLECMGATARLYVLQDGQTAGFLVDRPSSLILRGTAESSVQLACGPQETRSVTVEYLPQPDRRTGTLGVVRGLTLE